MMMKQLCTLCFTLCLLLLSVSGALAEKARAIETDADSAYHAVHLLLHLNTTECHATGNYIKNRTQPNGSVVAGHLEQADSFSLLAIENGWAKIEVIASDKTSPDSWAGMTGWVNADYVDCECSEADYYDGTDGYDSILDWFYLAISEKFDDQVIADAGFEPWEFPDDLNTSGFVYWDINTDGIDELFILRDRNAEIGSIIAGYTLVNGHPVRMFSSWARNRYYLRSDGSLYNTGSNGAAYAVHYIFDLIDSKLEVREGVLSGDCIEDKGENLSWFLVDERADFSYTDHELISQEEAQRRIESYKQSVVWKFSDFTSFAEYKSLLIH
ncbi:MAG: hypothetical protein ACI4MU_01760 [Candidatus Ventricola sp.]